MGKKREPPANETGCVRENMHGELPDWVEKYPDEIFRDDYFQNNIRFQKNYPETRLPTFSFRVEGQDD